MFSSSFLTDFLGQKDVHFLCHKFQRFLLEEFGRLFKMNSELVKKETATSEKLLQALEKCDALDFEVQKLNDELNEYRSYDFM